VQMRIELKNLHRTLRSTMIYVTHDQVEAMTLADRIVVLRGGVVEQVGAPLELYQKPANLFVAGFLGSPAMNLITGRIEQVDAGRMSVRVAGGTAVQVTARAGLKVGASVTLGVRAEHMVLEPVADNGGIHVVVQAAELLGDASYVYLTPDGGMTQFIARVDAEARWQNGQMARVHVAPERWHVFNQDGVALP